MIVRLFLCQRFFTLVTYFCILHVGRDKLRFEAPRDCDGSEDVTQDGGWTKRHEAHVLCAFLVLYPLMLMNDVLVFASAIGFLDKIFQLFGMASSHFHRELIGYQDQLNFR